MDKIVVFETYYNPIEANIVKARLIDSGIQCFLSDENTITINPLYTQALGGVKLHLFERDVAAATSILQDENVELNIQEATDTGLIENLVGAKDVENALICPNCGSDNVGYVQATKNRFGLFTIIVSLLLLVYPFNVKKTHHCFNCEHEF